MYKQQFSEQNDPSHLNSILQFAMPLHTQDPVIPHSNTLSSYCLLLPVHRWGWVHDLPKVPQLAE